MKRYIVEKDFMVDEFRCVIIGQKIGHRCGYIAIPKEHELYGKDYDEIDISVHGGLTYASYSEGEYPVKSEKSVYWIGFDCAHYMDGRDLELIKSFGEDDIDVKNMLELERKYPIGGEIRTVEYVENELIEMVNQIKKGEV